MGEMYRTLMKTFGVVLTLSVGVALAGVGTLSPSEAEEKLYLFSKLCLSGTGSEYGQDLGGVQVFCKRSPHVWREDHTHEVHKNLGGSHQQEIFVQPSQIELNHRVLVNAQLGGGRTKVYVVPNQVSNNYQVDVRGEGGQADKPTVYYLNHGSSSSNPGQPSYPSDPPSLLPPSTGYPNKDLVEYPTSVSKVPPKQQYGSPGY